MPSRIRRMGLAFAMLAGGIAPAMAGPIEPIQFASLGTLSLSAGTYSIDSTGATPTLTAGGTTYRGVISNGVAVFDFSSINIASGALLAAVKGAGLPIALLSQSSAIINGRIDDSAFGATEGAGASNTGVGASGGRSSSPLQIAGGGGGGFGGAGGMGGNNGNLIGGAGGTATALGLFSQLQGGSSGGGFFGAGGGGGGGGGAIEIGAIQNLVIGGEIDAIGGDGVLSVAGGGSGGGIFLHASSVLVSGTLDVQGGAGAIGAGGPSGYPGSGGGGGGLIAVDYSPTGSYTAGTNITSGGAGGSAAGGPNAGQSGMNGRADSVPSYTPAVPEPSSLVLLGTSTLGLLGAAGFRRLRERRGTR